MTEPQENSTSCTVAPISRSGSPASLLLACWGERSAVLAASSPPDTNNAPCPIHESLFDSWVGYDQLNLAGGCPIHESLFDSWVGYDQLNLASGCPIHESLFDSWVGYDQLNLASGCPIHESPFDSWVGYDQLNLAGSMRTNS
jgi:hypothetical protein